MSLKFIVVTLFSLCIANMIANRYKIKNLKISNFRSKYVDTITKNIDTDHNNKTTLEFTTGAFYIPKENKASPRGEDAHFICKSRNIIGVADGVGSWAAKGIDAGIFARELVSNAVTAVLDQNKGSISPRSVLQSAYMKTYSKGTSTACIIALNDNNVLSYANLGDSGFVLFRGKKVLYRSPVQHHMFNMPYQLGTGSRDTPDLAYEEDIYVEDGDIVVVGTDGLFDNVYDYEIEEILNRKEDANPDKLARKLAELALSNARDEDYLSPFAKAAEKEGFKYKGGKYDDITVVVAKIESVF